MSTSHSVSTSTAGRIRLCILWHQHQPYYKVGNRFVMPWVWLHATKDYLEMAQHLERHPGVKASINLVPSLIKQLREYLAGDAFDPIVALMARPSADLTDVDNEIILDNFFLANPSTVIERSPRYRELYDRWSRGDRIFSEQDFRDVTMHYTLAWTGALNRRIEPWKHLVEKDRDYTEEDRVTLVGAQRAAVESIVNVHKQLARRKQVELSTTPFYHPILPLLIDTDTARESVRDVSLPITRFRHTEDAQLQIERALRYFREEFGVKPKGMWPSEGSVSDAALRSMADAGITWAATDEGVLQRSLGRHPSAHSKLVEHGLGKYLPWRIKNGPVVFFRDHRLSDNIGFAYQSWKPNDAVQDFVSQIESIRENILRIAPNELPNACVSVILDGENCWEYYPDNGAEFLDTLYSALEESRTIETCTFSEVASNSEVQHLEHIVAGSWINSNFRIWIGHPEDNAAWDALAAARKTLERFAQRLRSLHGAAKQHAHNRYEEALEHILIAEGSDWCWWYGDDHHSLQRDLFDAIFRQYLRAVYALLDKPVPEDLLVPIVDRPGLSERYHRPSEAENRSVEIPNITGRLLNDSWIGVPNCAPPKTFGAMHRSFDRELEDVRVAQVGGEILLRLIVSPVLPEECRALLEFEEPSGFKIGFSKNGVRLETKGDSQSLRGFCDETLECAIPIGALSGTKHLRFRLEVHEPDGKLTVIPETGVIECSIAQY